jgi:Zn-dependent M16 (insulinase) family peptidase
MRKYQDLNKSINESSAEETLLDNLFNFYLAKYSGSSVEEVEKHFLNALASLVERGEIDKRTVDHFLDEKGIEGELPKKPEKVVYRDTYNDGGCGYSRSSRSSC